MAVDRIIIYPKDVELITGKGNRYARLLLRKIRDHLSKDKHHFVSLNDFCNFTGLTPQEVTERLVR